MRAMRRSAEGTAQRTITSGEDQRIKCVDCGAEFTFTVGEQEFFRDHGFTNVPTRCKSCRAKRKGARPGDGAGGGGEKRHGASAGATKPMFPAVCSQCGKETQVPFQPRNDKPVYCSDCFETVRAGRGY